MEPTTANGIKTKNAQLTMNPASDSPSPKHTAHAWAVPRPIHHEQTAAGMDTRINLNRAEFTFRSVDVRAVHKVSTQIDKTE